jgi:serine O-acetyltransferase
MECRLNTAEVAAYTAAQLNSFFPDGRPVDPVDLARFVAPALERVEYCFRHVAYRSYCEDGRAKFDPLHSDQYCAYLYFVANTVYRHEGDPVLATKLYYLNKALHAFNCMYDTALPDVFLVAHAVGTVLGKAAYSNYLVVLHNCTVGSLSGRYPTLGERLILCAGSSVIGDCRVGDNVMLAPGCTVIRQDVPSDTLVVPGPGVALRPNSGRAIATFFRSSDEP